MERVIVNHEFLQTLSNGVQLGHSRIDLCLESDERLGRRRLRKECAFLLILLCIPDIYTAHGNKLRFSARASMPALRGGAG
jgi:hypothetical protein